MIQLYLIKVVVCLILIVVSGELVTRYNNWIDSLPKHIDGMLRNDEQLKSFGLFCFSVLLLISFIFIFYY